jgi:hypothetical protein
MDINHKSLVIFEWPDDCGVSWFNEFSLEMILQEFGVKFSDTNFLHVQHEQAFNPRHMSSEEKIGRLLQLRKDCIEAIKCIDSQRLLLQLEELEIDE